MRKIFPQKAESGISNPVEKNRSKTRKTSETITDMDGRERESESGGQVETVYSL